MDAHMLRVQTTSLYSSFAKGDALIQHNNRLSRRCGTILCEYCDRLGQVKRTFFKTREMLTTMITSITPETLPTMFFPKHLRSAYGNYQAYILRNGIYLNVWPMGGHHSAYESLCDEGRAGVIKVHAQMRSDIQFSYREEPPTDAQIAVIREMIIDSTDELWFSFPYDINHPDPDFAF